MTSPPETEPDRKSDPPGGIVVVFILLVAGLIVLPIHACSEASREVALQFARGVRGRDAALVERLAMEPLAASVLRCFQGVCEGPAAGATQATLAASQVESTANIGINGDHCVQLLAQQGDQTTRLYRTTLPTHPAQCLVLQGEGEAPLPVLQCGSIDTTNVAPGCRDCVAASLAQNVGHLHGRAPRSRQALV